MLKFTKYALCSKTPIAICCDFEAFVSPIVNIQGEESEGLARERRKKTCEIAEHQPSGFCYITIGPDGEIMKWKIYSGPNVIDTFLNWLLLDAELIDDHIFSCIQTSARK